MNRPLLGRLSGPMLAVSFILLGGSAAAAEYNLVIDETAVNITGRERTAMTINGQIPGPTLRFREGEEAVIHVTNRLDETTSIHWHGVIIPANMDGVPGVSFAGIPPGETFTYRFPVKQNGTYWYHSHSGLQEQSGVYAPLVVEPATPAPYSWDREYVVMLSDWTDEDPHDVLANLKKQSDYYNFQKRTVFDFFEDIAEKGLGWTISNRLAWGQMRMSPTDISDVTGYTYTFLMNGTPPEANWTALFRPGERVRLRFINGSAMTFYDVRIPGLKMVVVAADGQEIQPVPVDEFRIAVAETYDVIVEPEEDRAYTIFAEAMDRSGYTRGTLAPRSGMEAEIPPLRERPLLTMADMGMLHEDMEMEDTDEMLMRGAMEHGGQHGAADHGQPTAKGTDHTAAGHGEPMAKGMNHAAMGHGMHGNHEGATHGTMDPAAMREPLAETLAEPVIRHGPDTHGPGNASVAMMPMRRLDDPGVGLENAPHRVLVYADLRSAEPREIRPPDREIVLHLTGNMERFMWSIDGVKFSDAEPIVLRYGERVRFTLINDTMMNHPMHLHGMWSELVNGAGKFLPRKHTVNVKPGEIISFDVNADAMGDWAFHCHLLYHMETGMFRKVTVAPVVAGAE